MSKSLQVVKRVALAQLVVLVFMLVPGQASQRAVAIGINQYQHANRLGGCVSDATAMAGVLSARGFEVATLFDAQATRDGILASLRTAAAATRSGDELVIYYSGHGSFFPDRDSPRKDEGVFITLELGGRTVRGFFDQTLVPVDTGGPATADGRPWGAMILDDELYDILQPAAERGGQILFVSDSCNSGTVGRAFGEPSKPPALQVRDGSAFLPDARIWVDVAALGDGDPEPPPTHTRAAGRALDAPDPATAKGAAGSYVTVTGCRDDQFSYELCPEPGRRRGALTFTLMELLAADADPTLGQVQQRLDEQVGRNLQRYACGAGQAPPQNPQVQSFHGGFDTSRKLLFGTKTKPAATPPPGQAAAEPSRPRENVIELSVVQSTAGSGATRTLALRSVRKNGKVVLVSPRLQATDRVHLRLESTLGGYHVLLPYVGTSERFRDKKPEVLYPIEPGERAAVGRVWNGPEWRSSDAPGRNLVYLMLVSPEHRDRVESRLTAALQHDQFVASIVAKGVGVDADAMDIAAAGAGVLLTATSSSSRAPSGFEPDAGGTDRTVIAKEPFDVLVVPIVLDFGS